MGCCVSKVDPEEDDSIVVRGCTDIFWLVIYVAFWVLMLLIAAFSFVYGSPLRLINGYDSFGNTCGIEHNKRIGNMALSGMDTSDKPFLFFMNVTDLKKTLKICVKECPKQNLDTIEDVKAYYEKTGTNLCRYDFDFKELDKDEIRRLPDRKKALSTNVGPCPSLPVYDSVPVLNRCVPRPVTELIRGFSSNFYELLNNWDAAEQILGDLFTSWKELLALAFFALVVSIFTVSILHLLATLVSVIIMLLVCITSVGGTAYLWYTYYQLRTSLDKLPPDNILFESIRNETAFLWYSIIATVITFVLFILMFTMSKQVGLLSEMFRETTHCLMRVPMLFLQPLITFVFLLGFFAFWITVVVCLATSYYMDVSSLKPYSNKSGMDVTEQPLTGTTDLKPLNNIAVSEVKMYTLIEYVDPTWVKYMWWVYLIGLIWTTEFIMACQQMVIAGAVAHWFYRNRYKKRGHINYAVCKLIKYHLGSMALGSLLITIFKIPRLILTYLHAKMTKNDDSASECAKCCLKGCVCCFYCLEKFIRYLNHNAYTVIAIDGVNFCTAAATAFEVLLAHTVQIAYINTVGDFILFLGKCFVTAITGIVGLYFFKNNDKLTFYAAPTLFTCVFAFFIAHCILSLYEMVLDTLYLCRCQNGETTEVQNGNHSEAARQQTELEPMNNE